MLVVNEMNESCISRDVGVCGLDVASSELVTVLPVVVQLLCLLLYMLLGNEHIVDSINSHLPDQIQVLGMSVVSSDSESVVFSRQT